MDGRKEEGKIEDVANAAESLLENLVTCIFPLYFFYRLDGFISLHVVNIFHLFFLSPSFLLSSLFIMMLSCHFSRTAKGRWGSIRPESEDVQNWKRPLI